MTQPPAEGSTPASGGTEPKPRSWLGRALIGLALLVLAAPVALWFLLPRFDLASLAAGRATALLGRGVSIEALHVTPGARLGITLRGLRLANLEGGTREDMLRLEVLTLELDALSLWRGAPILHDAAIEGLSILLERNAAGAANWHFGAPGPGGMGRGAVPHFGRIRLLRSDLTFRTSGGNLLPTVLEEASLTATGPDAPITLHARGSYQGVPITLEGPLGSIAALRDAATSFPLDLSATAADMHLALIGSAGDPLNFDGLQGQLELRAPNPRALLGLAGARSEGVPAVALQLAGTLERQGDLWRMQGIEGALDGAGFAGRLLQLTEGARGEPDALVAELAFARLDMNRLLRLGGDFDGGEPDLPLATFTAPDPLIEARINAAELVYGGLQAREARLEALIVPGEIRVPRLSMRAFGTRIAASGRLEAAEDGVDITADASFEDGDLDVLRRAFGLRDLPLAGRVEGRAAITGRGQTLNSAAREARISAVVAMSGGTVAREVIEMASTDVRALFRTARGRTRLSCMIAVVDMQAGRGEVAPLRLRAATGTISGLASFDLNRQQLDLVIGSQRQTTGSFALDIPVRVSGSFSAPELLPAQWSGAGRARLAAPDHVAPLPPALRSYAQRSPCYFGGGR